MNDPKVTRKLPLKNEISSAQSLSLIVTVLMGLMSLAGLIFQARIYPSEEVIQSLLANDVVNLFIGVPILLISMWLTKRSELIGLLLWPGALVYVLYNYIAYVFGMSFQLISIAYLALVLLSAYAVFDLLKSIDEKSVQAQLSGAVPEKIAGWVLIVFGVMFIFRAISIIADAAANQSSLQVSEIGTLIADLIISALWIAGGSCLLRRKPLGYVSGLGLLFAGSTLFIGLILFLLLQPVLTDAPFSLTDVIVVFIMGLICFLPFGLYLRGVVRSRS